jgi:hypothetical protein
MTYFLRNRHQHGYSKITCTETGKVLQEADTVQCAHCQRHGQVVPGTNPEDLNGARCKKCMGLVCHHCAGKECMPWEEVVQRYERAQARSELRGVQ